MSRQAAAAAAATASKLLPLRQMRLQQLALRLALMTYMALLSQVHRLCSRSSSRQAHRVL
jgi:hypothetical protein